MAPMAFSDGFALGGGAATSARTARRSWATAHRLHSAPLLQLRPRPLAAVAAGPAVGTARVPQCADLVLLHTTSNPCDSTRVALQRFRRIVQSLRVVYTHVGSESCGVPSLYVGEAPEELYNRNGGKPAKVEWQEGLNNSGLPVEHPEFFGCCSEELVLAYIKTNMLPGVRASAWVVDSASTSAGASVAADASVGSGAGAGAGAGAGGRH